MTNPTVSVIIPAYNCHQVIHHAIESVLLQTYKDFEIIVVDDGSTDNTAEKVKRYVDKVNYIRQENGGVSKARNTGIGRSNGKYIAFLDSDDRWEKNKLEIQLKCFEMQAEANLLFSSFKHRKNNKIMHEMRYEDTFNIFKEYKITIEDIFEFRKGLNYGGKTIDCFWGNVYPYLFLGNFILPSSVILKRESLKEVGLFNERYRVAEETEFFLKYSKHNAIGFINSPLLYYELPESDNLSGKKNMEKLMKNALKTQIDSLLPDYKCYQKRAGHYDKGLSMTYCRLAYYYLSEYKIDEARKYAMFGIRAYYYHIKAYVIYLSTFIPKSILASFEKMKKWARKRSIKALA
jgi:glycosyltransferase involved in cell wall biosynthesis